MKTEDMVTQLRPGRMDSSAKDVKASGDPICGDLDIRIARDGTWYYCGSPIGRQSLVKLFSTVLKREADGQYYLETPVEKGRIEVEDAPFLAIELFQEGAGRGQNLRLRTNIDDTILVSKLNPLRVTNCKVTDEPSPYVLVRNNLEALICRSVFYEIVAIAVAADDDQNTLGIWSSGDFFPIGSLSADLGLIE